PQMDGTRDHCIALGDEVGRQIAGNWLHKARRAESHQHVEEAPQIRGVLVWEYNAFSRRGPNRRHAAKSEQRQTQEAEHWGCHVWESTAGRRWLGDSALHVAGVKPRDADKPLIGCRVKRTQPYCERFRPRVAGT